MDVGAVILAGGKSSRMGTNKALLKINEMTGIERIIRELSPVFRNPILVTNNPESYQFLRLRLTQDHFPGKGPLAGIHAGLMASSHEVNLITACDMPFVSAALAWELVNKIRDYDVVVPVIMGRQHPLFSVFKKKVALEIEDSIKNDHLSMKQLLEKLNVLYVTEHDLDNKVNLERIFFNMNSPNEYEKAKNWARPENPKKGED